MTKYIINVRRHIYCHMVLQDLTNFTNIVTTCRVTSWWRLNDDSDHPSLTTHLTVSWEIFCFPIITFYTLYSPQTTCCNVSVGTIYTTQSYGFAGAFLELQRARAGAVPFFFLIIFLFLLSGNNHESLWKILVGLNPISCGEQGLYPQKKVLNWELKASIA